MRRITLFLLFILHLPILATTCYSSGDIKVSFVNPDPPGSLFWDKVTQFMQAVSRDLNIDLTVHYGDVGRFRVKDIVEDITRSKNKPDYIITLSHLNTTAAILKLTQEAGIKVFFINTDISSEEKMLLGSPRTTYNNWLGQMIPDDRQGGYDLTISLAREYNRLHRDGLHLIAFSGSRDASASLYRNEGLDKAAQETNSIDLQQTFFLYWSEEKSQRMITPALTRYPETNAVWVASSAMAQGVIRGLHNSTREAGKDILIGCFDWPEATLKAIEDGTITASMGGHFTEGGWSLILLHDYHHGIDFSTDPGLIIRSQLEEINRTNIENYRDILTPEYWDKMDFRAYSKFYNKDLSKYAFSLAEKK